MWGVKQNNKTRWCHGIEYVLWRIFEEFQEFEILKSQKSEIWTYMLDPLNIKNSKIDNFKAHKFQKS